MRGEGRFTYDDFSQGLNTDAAPYNLSDGQARSMLNVNSTARGGIVKRRGRQTLGTQSGAGGFHSLYAFEAGATPFLIAALPVAGPNTTLYSVGTGGTVTSRKTGLNATARWEFISAPVVSTQGPLFGMNGTNTPQQWDGAAGSFSDWTANGTSNLPNGKYVKYVNDRVWVAGMSAYTPFGGAALEHAGSAVVFSGIGDARDFPAANVVTFDRHDGDTITGLGTIGPYLLVFKKRKCWVIYDLDTGDNRQISTNIGCAAHRSIVETPGGTFFLTDDQGVYVTDGTQLQRISKEITPTVATMVAASRANAAGAFFDDHYYLSYQTGTVNDRTLDFDLTLRSWWLHDIGSNQWAVWHPTGDIGALYDARADLVSGNALVEKAFVQDVYADNSTAYSSFWQGAWLAPNGEKKKPNPYIRKRLREVRFDGIGAVDFYLATDFAGGSALKKSSIFTFATSTFGGTGSYGGSGTFGEVPDLQLGRAPTPGAGRAFSLKFTDPPTPVAAKWEVDSFTLAITDRKD